MTTVMMFHVQGHFLSVLMMIKMMLILVLAHKPVGLPLSLMFAQTLMNAASVLIFV
jgi:hypothetical protein